MIESVGGNVAVKPPEKTSAEVRASRGVATIAQKQDLTPLTVVFRSEASAATDSFHVGDVVYVLGDNTVNTWASKVYTVNGQEFVLCPVKQILLRESHE